MNIDPVKALDDKVERLKKDLKDLTSRLDNAETDAAQNHLSATNQIRDTKTKITKTNDRITELAESVHRLERLLVALNRRARAGGETRKADLDDWPEISQSLIAKILAGQEAYAKKRHTPQELKATKSEVAKYDATARQAIEAAEALTTLPATAESLWRTKYNEWRTLVKAGERPEIPEEPQDDSHIKAAGNEAVEEARTKIRTRIEEAVAKDLLFPAWFENALGPAAPPGKASDWLYTATDVVLYRLLHDIDSQADALGPPPQHQGHRRELHDRLIIECAEHRL